MKTSSASPPPPPLPSSIEEKVYRHVERVSLSDLLVEADVILQSSSSTSSTKNSKMSPRFGGNKVVVSTTDDDNNNNNNTALFPRALLKRLKPAFASFCRRFHHHQQRNTGGDSGTIMFTMNSKAWLSVLTESNLLSKTFSTSRAIGCYENVVSRRRESYDERQKKKKNTGRDDDEEECGNEERRITFEEFATLLGEAVAKAYDVEAKAVGKRVVATAYAMERKREEEERGREMFVSDAVIGGGDNDDDDDDNDDDYDYYEYELRYGVENINNNNANNISRRPRTMATTQPAVTSSKSVTNNNPDVPASPSAPSLWRIRAERYTNRYNRSSLDGNHLASSSSLAAANSARGRYWYDETDEEDFLLEDRVANAFETVFCQSLATTTGPSSSSSAFPLGGGGGGGGGGERRRRKTIDEREFVKICTACALIGNSFTASDCLDVAFAVGAAEKNGEITTRAFLRALRKIASAHDVSFADVARRVVAVSKALLRER